MTVADICKVDERACDGCGRDNPVWFAPNDLWNLVLGGPEATEDPGGLICPTCFIFLAEAVGVRPTGWMVVPEPGVAPAVVEGSESSGAVVDAQADGDHATAVGAPGIDPRFLGGEKGMVVTDAREQALVVCVGRDGVVDATASISKQEAARILRQLADRWDVEVDE